MKTRIVILLLILIPALVFAQHFHRPIIDSTVACSYYKYDFEFFYIVEHMPLPTINLTEVENAVKETVHFSEQEKTSSGEIYFQCIVNCKGIAGDFQIIRCPTEFANICSQVFYVIREKLIRWQPGNQHKQDVDMLITIKATVDKGNIKIVAPS